MIPARLANWLIAKAKQTPYSHIYGKDGDLYMARYWLVPFKHSLKHGSDNTGCYVAKWYRQPLAWLLQTLGIAVRVHNIRREDLDRHMHDHPWPFISVVLRGWYIECIPLYPDTFAANRTTGRELEKAIFRRQGTIAFRGVDERHRIDRVPADGVVTLFITFRYRQTWGFYTPEGKVPWREYLAAKGKDQ